MSVCDLRPGETGYIKNIYGDNALTKRLSSLGVIEGTKVKFKNVAPLGDPIIINLKGSDIAIRKRDAKNILIMEE
ncbi:MAG: ferrous iron transport protein A [Clostridiaceae bacterium]